MDDHQVVIAGTLTDDDGFSEIRPAGWDANQTGTCIDCGGTWVWAENGYVPGTRKCTSCGSLFNVQRGGDEGWLLCRERLY